MKLNVGSGSDIKSKEKGWINLDFHKTFGAEVIFNLENLYKGEKLPFKDNQFEYVYCSHVLEDFIEPIVIIEELIRICKVGGKIEIRTPFETNNNLTNIRHKSFFTLCKFNGLTKEYAVMNYGKEYPLKVKEIKYYSEGGRNKFSRGIKNLIVFFYNLIPYKIVERTFLKYLFCILNCKVVYKKIK